MKRKAQEPGKSFVMRCNNIKWTLHSFWFKGHTVKKKHVLSFRKTSALPSLPTGGRGCQDLLPISPQIRTFCISSCGSLAEETELLFLYIFSELSNTDISHPFWKLSFQNFFGQFSFCSDCAPLWVECYTPWLHSHQPHHLAAISSAGLGTYWPSQLPQFLMT